MVVGFIGCGNMGSAILEGVINSRIIQTSNITISDSDENKVNELKEKYKIMGSTDNVKTAQVSDILFLCVKPNMLSDVIKQIKDRMKTDNIIVSIAAGQKIENIEKMFGKKTNIVRAMPNTPALVSAGMSAISLCKELSLKQYTESVNLITKIFNSFGKCAVIPEEMMDAVTAVSGSSPAYVFMFIEAMADAAVKAGMGRKNAYVFAAQAVFGSAKMVLETGKHPAELKDMVCSPAGTTIDAVKVLEDKGFRGIIMDAIDACVKKSTQM